MSDFGIYVHWPFCAAKCPYCDFNSHVRESFDEARWAGAVERELETVAALQGGEKRTVSSIFFGGGTPSLMQGATLARVLEKISVLWPMDEHTEITLEANPNSVEQARFRDYRSVGVNRVSIGVQSLNDGALKALGRLHGADEARRAAKLAIEIFPRANLDLIYARPGQSPREWASELAEALSYGATHMSLYQLTIEPGTSFATLHAQGKLVLPAEDDAVELFEVTQEMCEAKGLGAYEVSNHAAHGAQCRHNLLYWRYGDYAGVGPGAHGRLTLGGKRYATLAERLPERWLKQVESEGFGFTREEVVREDGAREHLLMGLRLSEGIDLAEYERRWDVRLPREKIAHLAREHLLAHEGERLKATRAGRLVLNSLIAELAN